jgi:hypothetical protein
MWVQVFFALSEIKITGTYYSSNLYGNLKIHRLAYPKWIQRRVLRIKAIGAPILYTKLLSRFIYAIGNIRVRTAINTPITAMIAIIATNEIAPKLQ